MLDIRVGYGYDVHRLEAGLPLTIGGVKIPYEKGWVAHSDGDVLLHAICDAILGAAAMRDIGFHFPDNSKDFEGIDSRKLLRRCVEIIAEKGYRVSNVDSTIAMQKPKLKDLIPQMQHEIAQAIGIDDDRISVKATTTEKLSFEGEGTGASAYAVVLIMKE
ncbi:MAG: 2-C-methyl-D-erythritol 2,4-cyclodiphosphate synthase [Bacteroidales bacterium]|jgi:2-C-methyl-D-erythritol 2,4-cyclodiphosphate synthase|nr:2-C-methyl-D-erythritol 2,4-cyclodiphosphate synthase [Bacteroidales bacterium]